MTALPHRFAGRVLVCALAVGSASFWCRAAAAQRTVPPPGHAADGVIRPPATVDPKMTVAPPPTARMPTPVVHSPAPPGTVVVPK